MADKLQYCVDLADCNISVRTRAQGLLARLAHALELSVHPQSCDIENTDDGWQGTMLINTEKIEVVGALKNNRVDRSILSSKDIRDIQKKLREDVLTGPQLEVRWKASESRGYCTVMAPQGSQRLSFSQNLQTTDAGASSSGSLKISLRALGIREVKAPLGAFKVSDAIEINWQIGLTVTEPAPA